MIKLCLVDMSSIIPSPFLISFLINVILFVCLLVIVYRHKGKIVKKIRKFTNWQTIPTDQVLSTFNNEPMEAVNEMIDIGADTTITFLFLGNSLTYTGVPDEEPDKERRGATSTSKDKDYVHLLMKRISSSNSVNVDFSVVNIADFERGFKRDSLNMEHISNAKNLNPDYLIVQIGENVSINDLNNPKVYEDEYVKLLSMFPQSEKIITIPFWPSKVKEYVTTNVAIRSGAFLVDLAHLGDGTDKLNFASSYRKYKQPGVGAHPGDYGMQNIANCIFATFEY